MAAVESQAAAQPDLPGLSAPPVSAALFPAEVTKVLAASLDYSTTLDTLARLAVSHLADWCLVDVVETDGLVYRVAVAHVDPRQQATVERLTQMNAIDRRAGGVVLDVLQSGQAALVNDVAESLLVANARNPEHLDILRALDPRSVMVVPLRARGRILGALTLVSSDPARRYDAAALARAEEFVQHAALAVDNARLYREAQEANRLKDEFLGIVSHELRTPLTAIFAWVRLLRSRRLDEDKVTRALAIIERNARAQSQVIDDLLDVSRIIFGKLRLDRHAVELRPVVEAAVESVRPLARARGVQLHLAPGSAPVLGDVQRLQQIVRNLLDNAVKFTPSGGRVDVGIEQADDAVTVRVRDTGAGIGAAFLPYVFDRFRQADSSTTRPHGGLGLGLAIVRHLVELHGGTVKAASEGEGRGSTFTVALPSPHEHELLPAPLAPGEPDVTLDGVRVLAVDDNADARDFIVAILEDCGAQVTAAASVREAVDVFARTRPHVLIGDITMPGDDGYVLIERVRRMPADAGGNVPAIALTASASPADRRRTLQAGYQLHVTKPFEPSELIDAVARFLQPTARVEEPRAGGHDPAPASPS
jgi:signal transduction histidine kinase/ActR/RegA family two-component response regulator